jgi:hypothetical protein
MTGVWVDLLNALVGEFGSLFFVFTMCALVLLLVFMLVDGVLGVPGCLERRAARKKEEYVALMRDVLRDFRVNPVDVPLKRIPYEPQWKEAFVTSLEEQQT